MGQLNFNPSRLTKHQRHARLLKIVRKDYQKEHPGSRLFPNPSGMAYQGQSISGAGKVELFNPRVIRFGIPEPSGNGEKSGGSDLLGWTIKKDFETVFFMGGIPIITGIECKTGKSPLKKNQKVFRDNLKKANGIYYLARECPKCWKKWVPVWENGKIGDWFISYCECCGGKGYILED